MISSAQNSKRKSHQSASTQPHICPKRSKHFNPHELTAIKVTNRTNATLREPFKLRQPKVQQEKKSMSTRELSIDQIKTRIRQYLGHNGETEAIQYLGNEFASQAPQRTSQEQFRVSMFKNNARRKINLKILEGLTPKRYQQSTKQFSIREACINRRILPRQAEADFLVNKHGVKARLADYKMEKRKRTRNSVFEQPREGKSSQLHRFEGYSRPATPKGWDSLMQPWRKWEENKPLEGHSFY